jgi:bacterioferritin (cytochrome b1)
MPAIHWRVSARTRGFSFENADNGSRDLFVELLKDEEEQVDWLGGSRTRFKSWVMSGMSKQTSEDD